MNIFQTRQYWQTFPTLLFTKGQNSGNIVEDSTKHKGGNDGIHKTTAQHSEIPDEKKNFEFENYNQWDTGILEGLNVFTVLIFRLNLKTENNDHV